MFQRSSLFHLRLFLLIVISIVLMFYDQRQKGLVHLRSIMLTVVSPLQSMATWPVEVINKIKANTQSHQTLLEENTQLRAEALIMQAKMQRIVALRQENTQLRALLQSSADIPQHYMAARLLAVSSEPNVAQVVLDRGSRHHVYLGQPVIDDQGVMGQIFQLGRSTSRVMLLTDSKSAIPVQNQRTGERGIVVGMGAYQPLRLLNMTESVDVQEGDLLVTSGLGLRYPPGYPVGVVKQIQQKSGNDFLQVSVQPSAGIARSRQVLLVWQTQEGDQYA
jgi:rod shape-determining protein MreC